MLHRLVLLTIALFSLGAPALAAEPSPREVTSLSEGWHFQFGDVGDAPAQAGFDDAGWDKVSVPHTWNKVGNYGTTRDSSTDNRQGIGWYRLTYNAPPAAKGRRQYLDFAAVGKIARVWVNGQFVGEHRGAYGRFRFEVTKHWKPGQANLIAVRADNSKPEAGKPTGETIPLAGDFFVYGGLYRQVQLITANAAGIDLLDYGSPGVFVRTASIVRKSGLPDEAVLDVTARLREPRRNGRTRVSVTIRDAAGAVVADRAPMPAKYDAAVMTGDEIGTADGRIALTSPRYWDGTRDPYLYTATVEVRKKGKLIDSVTQTFGIRDFRVDANEGFFLNPHPMVPGSGYVRLHGVSRHQDKQGKGAALTAADHAEDMALMKELGANTVRHAHYQHADEWSDEADKAGMIVWAELPYVTSPGLAGGKGSPELWANAEQQLKELIRQNYNHPSIVMWSVGNEVDSAKGFGKAAGDPLPLLKHLNAIAKVEDPSRPTTFADCCEGLQILGMDGSSMLAGAADLIGYNRYFGWYMPKHLEARAQAGAEFDRLHAKHPTLPISISEWGAGGATTQHSDDVKSGFLNFIGRPQPEEYQSYAIEQNWLAMKDRKYLYATWLWNMFDFASDLRGEGDAVDVNTKGVVTYDRKLRKDAFYFLKANWNPEPMVWITGKRHALRPYPTAEVKAYSNAERASLSINGRDLGEVACADRICLWPSVALAKGENRVVVSASHGSKMLRDEAVWTGPDTARGLALDAGDLAGQVVAGKPFGSDAFVTGGRTVPLSMGGFGSNRAPSKKVIAERPEHYAYWREGEAFSYALPVADGNWTVTVHTFQPDAALADSSATMAITANGKPGLAPFAIGKEAGGPLKGLAKSFSVTVKGGVLKLDFSGQGGNAVVAALEVTPR
ncbi:glycoside hydrolase family 2 TIM barrel-domain containing protein [Novosphingobium aquae]|uniref:Glycoside hydrolase family 2 TIM barrel-domain containing protein n=1 Tax=Novosphingobium aquae TaxID=3133435 RepID=A0ABU8S7C9_9SPHN